MKNSELKCGSCNSSVRFSKGEADLLPVPNYCTTCGAKFFNGARVMVPYSYTCRKCEHVVNSKSLVPHGTVNYCERCGESLSPIPE